MGRIAANVSHRILCGSLVLAWHLTLLEGTFPSNMSLSSEPDRGWRVRSPSCLSRRVGVSGGFDHRGMAAQLRARLPRREHGVGGTCHGQFLAHKARVTNTGVEQVALEN